MCNECVNCTCEETKVKPNWFNILNQSLESEGLVDTWNCTDSIGYGETFRWYFNRGTKAYVATIFREVDGTYERPVWYQLRGGN